MSWYISVYPVPRAHLRNMDVSLESRVPGC
jgi:hypothetical protein